MKQTKRLKVRKQPTRTEMAKSPASFEPPSAQPPVPEPISPPVKVAEIEVPQPNPDVNPDVNQHSTALETLCEMGFIDLEKNAAALVASKGNIEGAIVLLLAN